MSTPHAALTQHLQRLHGEPLAADAARHETARILKAEGLTDAETMAAFLNDGLARVKTNPRRGPAGLAVAATQARLIQERVTTRAPAPKPHRLAVPAIYKGSLRDPEDINKLTGQYLHYVVASAGGSRHVAVFDHFAEAAAYGRSLPPQEPGRLDTGIEPSGFGSLGGDNACPADAPQPTANAVFFEHIDYDGESIEVGPDRGIPDLPAWRRHGFLFIETSDWNDSISSVRVGDATVVAFEHTNYQGSTLTLHGSTPVPVTQSVNCKSYPGGIWQNRRVITAWQASGPREDIARLTEIGWNDRISSILHGSYF